MQRAEMATKTRTRAADVPLTETSRPTGREGRHKTVFANAGECAHAWAARVQDYGRSANTNFSGGTFYSYGDHFPVARHVKRKGGASTFVLFTTRSYSSTTSGHKSDAESAIRGRTVYHVANVHANTRGEHLANFRDMENDANNYATKAKRARTNGEWYTREAVARVQEANAYAEAVGLRERLPVPSADEVAAWIADAAKRTEERSEAEKRKTAQAERRARAALALRVAEWEQRVSAWRDGAEWPGYCPDRSHPLAQLAFLRVRGGRLETSMRAVVPVKATLPILAHVRSGTPYDPAALAEGEKPLPAVADFVVNEIDAGLKLVRIGCHVVTFEEIERAAKAAGL